MENIHLVVPLGTPKPLTDPTKIVALIDYATGDEPAYTVYASTELLARQILDLISQPYKTPFSFSSPDGELTGFGVKIVSPGQPRHFNWLDHGCNRHHLLDPLSLTVSYFSGPEPPPLPTFPVQVSRSFPPPTPG